MLFSKTVLLNNLQQTATLAKTLVERVKLPATILLSGPMGIGKTQFAKFFALYLGIEQINSPSFVKMNIYYTAQNQKLIHFDGFHLDKNSDIKQFCDDFANAHYLLLEWPEAVTNHLPTQDIIFIKWFWTTQRQRMVTVESCYKILDNSQ